MKIAHDASGKVWLTGSGPFPAELNGISLTTRELSKDEEVAFFAQPASPVPDLIPDKRAAAIDALLAEQAKRADAPQAVKDFAA